MATVTLTDVKDWPRFKGVLTFQLPPNPTSPLGTLKEDAADRLRDEIMLAGGHLIAPVETSHSPVNRSITVTALAVMPPGTRTLKLDTGE